MFVEKPYFRQPLNMRNISFPIKQVKTSQEVCKKAKIPSVCFAEIAEKVFEMGPPAIRKYAPFARSINQ